jgi:ADP-ribosyl-[dinitrogen reductase] hydrolase
LYGPKSKEKVVQTIERYRGALLGLACGDAVGTALEFSKPGTFVPITDMIGGGPFNLQPGQWTDDTSMALCLAESLVECGAFDLKDQIERYYKWYDEGYLSSTGTCFDIGGTTQRALLAFKQSGDPLCGLHDERSAGNGSIMRLAPVPLFFAADAKKAIEMSGESSKTTHALDLCVDACRYFGGLLAGAVGGATKAQLLSPMYAPIEGYWDENPLCGPIAAIARGSFALRSPDEIRGTGYVVQSLEAALWAFDMTDTFESGCLSAANLGDDADTTAAVYGQLAGAFYGEHAIPDRWRSKLCMKQIIEGYAERLYQLSLNQ